MSTPTGYLCQVRTGVNVPLSLSSRRVKWGPWKTVSKEPAHEHGGAAAEAWLLRPVTGLTEKRLWCGSKRTGYALTREECRNAHAQTPPASVP